MYIYETNNNNNNNNNNNSVALGWEHTSVVLTDVAGHVSASIIA
jgi:hypothetical protein